MKQYFKYFKILYIMFAVMLVITLAFSGLSYLGSKATSPRQNFECPEERVFDDADVLTAEEEDKLRAQIAKVEPKIGCDIVLVTIKESVLDLYGYDENWNSYWEDAMTSYADDFYDLNNFGYNKIHGDGVLLLDNWYEDEEGSWFSTCGKAYERYTYGMIDEVLDEVYEQIEKNPYKAYSNYISTVEKHMRKTGRMGIDIGILSCFLFAFLPGFFFIVLHLKNSEGKKETVQNTYVDYEHGGTPVFTVQKDDLIDKRVTSCRIDTGSSSGGRSGGGGGRAGGHRSSSGVSHGGGGRRR